MGVSGQERILGHIENAEMTENAESAEIWLHPRFYVQFCTHPDFYRSFPIVLKP